ncbi:hypothetical protein SARC_09233 [Sphaeroforma arctica JP610]|uniref:MTOR-associated protein MEAK7 n=1 Tax=Sphaeroforma arctica JP610 TaxID=667725 RepID=A0A0L0FP99_9EUKA|nr:hypothetical protein SARC_09233 [Sphaeroforma arctica JP610]KNC78336.1 hypothetical protein SARC_09233 [Sphaeroforma arctica JP610]|eukprot:XP_014152238.1 hypothetical protein SARC_09233 [Sphaeroforma arctica JP610]
MGGSASKQSPEVSNAVNALGLATVKCIQSALGVDEDKYYHVELKDLKNIYPQWSDDMLETVRNGVRGIPDTPNTIPMHCWIVTLHRLASGSASHRQSAYFRLACGDEKTLTREKLVNFLTSVCKSAFAVDKDLKGKLDADENIDQNFVFSLMTGLAMPIEVDAFTTWMRRDPVVSNLLEFGVRYYMLQRTCGVYFENNVLSPRVIRPTPLQLKGFGQSRSKLMTREGIWYINAHLPKDMTSEWELLYDSESMGKAFAQFMAHSFDVSPIVFIIKDKDGYVFGGFVSEPLKLNASWYGNSDCFLFSLAPSMAVYHTTSYNKNYVYLNKAQKTLPNGFSEAMAFMEMAGKTFVTKEMGIDDNKKPPQDDA